MTRKITSGAGVLLLTFVLFGCHGTRPTDIGVTNGRLKPCPKHNNCVNSQADASDEKHYMAAISYTGTLEEVMTKIVAIVDKDATIVKQEANYLHAEYVIPVFGFTDDVEFYFDDQTKQIHFRSASRLGKGDLGVNRRRMEKFKKKFNGTD